MPETSGFFNAELIDGKYDRTYLAETFAEYFASFIANGVFPNPSTGLQVLAGSPEGMSVRVQPGYAWINGYWYKLYGDPQTLTIEVADGVLNRIDNIVVRWSKNARAIALAVVKGTPASDPVAPAVSRQQDIYELCIAQVKVNAAITKVTQDLIVDTRLKSDLCGIVTGVVQSIDTTTLFEQYQAALSIFEGEKQKEFDEWFATVQDTLDKDTAGNLLNLITQETKDREQADQALTNTVNTLNLGEPNATATLEGGVVKIVSNIPGSKNIYFYAPSDFLKTDTYTLDGSPITLKTLNNEDVEDAWKSGSPVQLIIKGDVGFFKSGGAGVNDNLPAQVTAFSVVDGSVGGVPKVTVSWQNPTQYFAGILIVRKAGSAPIGVNDGDKVYNGTGTSFVDTNIQFNQVYYYRAYPYNDKKQYQTLANTKSITPKSWKMPVFTGTGQASGNEQKGEYRCLTSGTLTLDSQTYDIFVVGGGSSGRGNYGSRDDYGAGGGGSGYTTTRKGVTYSGNCTVLIGSGGIADEDTDSGTGNHPGGRSSISLGSIIVSAEGGKNTASRNSSYFGSDGGSGGGNGGWKTNLAGDGGTDGADGEKGAGYGNQIIPKGQGTTTRSFGESSGTFFAGAGGGGAGDYGGTSGGGGTGGGGNGASVDIGHNGTANTGGGGGGGAAKVSSYPSSRKGGNGGSGIIIVRWGY